MPKYDTPAALTTVLDIPAGRIRLVASDRTDTTVEVLPANAARGRDVKAAGETTVTCTDGTLRITAPAAGNQLLGASGSVEITVQLPAGSHVQARAAAADLRGVGRLGDITYDVTQGARSSSTRPPRARITAPRRRLRIGRLNGPARDQHRQGRPPHHRSRPRHRRTAHPGTASLHRRRRRRLRLPRRRHHLRPHPQQPQERGRRRRRLTIHATTAYGDITARSL